ncbi:hypothetical protein QQF64_008761 [Cirrhinus molitorella]|uniref:Uncharacterized protein n=1 Tax=Cirrhinus molitorella TaxID=172907 RepID=A0ABR3MA61_9TELE
MEERELWNSTLMRSSGYVAEDNFNDFEDTSNTHDNPVMTFGWAEASPLSTHGPKASVLEESIHTLVLFSIINRTDGTCAFPGKVPAPLWRFLTGTGIKDHLFSAPLTYYGLLGVIQHYIPAASPPQCPKQYSLSMPGPN